MTGFIYIWRDAKRKKFYLGSHFGDPCDGYICGSRWMRKAHASRPKDFKRRIIKVMSDCDRSALYTEEQKWLYMIQPHEFGNKYYNLSANAYGADPILAREWMMGNQHGLGKVCSQEKRKKISDSQKGKYITLESRNKMRLAKLGRKQSSEQKLNKSKAATEFWSSGDIDKKKIANGKLISAAKKRANEIKRQLFGFVHSQETRQKISDTKRNRTRHETLHS